MMAMDELAEVEVSGLTADVDDDFLVLYFENKRCSGGGGIRTFTRNGTGAIITFLDPADAEGVLSKGEHRIHHVTVQVRRPPPWDLKKVILCGLDPNTEETLLELYVEAVSGQDTVSIVRSVDKASALLSFQEEIHEEDFHRLMTRVERKKLHNRVISVCRVRASGDILVENLGTQTSVELLEMYFESKRSGGGEVKSVTMLGDNSAAIVSFQDWNVVDQVLCSQHVLRNCQLSVSRYYPDLLGSPRKDLSEEEKMEEEPTKCTDTANMHQSTSQVIGAQAKDNEELSIPREDEKMVGVELWNIVKETQNDAHCYEGSEEQMQPEMPQIPLELQPERRPEMSLTGPHSQALGSTVHRYDELDSGRTLSSSDKVNHLPDPLQTFVSWGDEGGRETTGGASCSVHEAEVVMEAAELFFMQKYQHELLAGMDAVTIFPLEEDDKFGFKVVGDAFSCRTAVELLQHIVSSLSSRTITLEYPGVSQFLLEREGQRTLHDTETQHQCIIDTSQISRKVLDHAYVDPWSFVHDSAPADSSPVQSMITDEVPDNPLLRADMEGIKMFASLLKSEEKPNDTPTHESSTTIGCNIQGESSEEDLYTDRLSEENESPNAEVKDEELDQVCQMSRKEYQDRELDEEAQLLLAIQRSMDTQGGSVQEDEDELQRVLEMSLIQHQNEDTEESLQRALEMSLQDQRTHDYNEPMRMLEEPTSFNDTKTTLDLAQIRVLAGDETSIVVACAALRKAITSKLNTVSLEGTDDVHNISQILTALEQKHKVKMTKFGKELQIQGFLHGPSQCRQEMSEILNTLQARGQAMADVMNLDIDRDVEMIDVSDTSEEYQGVTQPFLDSLQDLKPSIEVLQVQKVHNPLLYNQYQLKKLRMVMSDPNQPAERILYHGTTETSAKEICHSGFNRSFCGKNAALYGQGVYFAVESDVSTRDHYSPPNEEGKKFVLVARVLTGEYTQGKENMKTPPPMPNATGEVPRRYDSLVNNMKKPSFYVIFNDTQAYPEYVITCRNRKGAPK